MLREPFCDWWARVRFSSPWRATNWEAAYPIWYLDHGLPPREFIGSMDHIEDEINARQLTKTPTRTAA